MDGKALPVLPVLPVLLHAPVDPTALCPENNENAVFDGFMALEGSILPEEKQALVSATEEPTLERPTSEGPKLEGPKLEGPALTPIPQTSVSALAAPPLSDSLRLSALLPPAVQVQPPQADRTDARITADSHDAPTLPPVTKPAPSHTDRVSLPQTAALQAFASARRSAGAVTSEQSGTAPIIMASVTSSMLLESPTGLVQTGATPNSFAAFSPSPSLPSDQPRDFAALMDRLVQAREATGPNAASTARIMLPHAEFGGVTMRFDTYGGHVTVGVTSTDPGFAPTIRAALSDAATGDPSQRGNQNGTHNPGHHSDQRNAQNASDTQSRGENPRDNRTTIPAANANDGDRGVTTLYDTASRDGLYI